MGYSNNDQFSNDRYRPGGFWRIDDFDGSRQRNYDTRKQWDGVITARENFSPRQPQDFVRGVPDIQTVPDARPPEPIEQAIFSGPTQTPLAANVAAGATTLTVQQSAGFLAGTLCQVFLDSTDGFLSSIASVPDATHIVLVSRLPSAASAQNLVISYIPPTPPNL